MIRLERLKRIPVPRGEAYFGRAILDDGERVECIIRYRDRRVPAAMTRVPDPRFLRVLGFEDVDDDRCCVAIEHVRGTSLAQLAQRLKREKRWFARADTIALGRELLGALASAHRAHDSATRIVDPANLIFADEGGLRVMPPRSCGIAIPYMSPEHVCGDAITAASDIWSAGVVLYEMWSGRHPFRGASELEFLKAIVQERPAPLPVPWIMSMLAERPRDRPDAREVSAMLPRSFDR